MKFAAKLEPDLYIIEITTTDTFLIVYKWQFSYRCYQIAYSKLTDVLNSQIFRHFSWDYSVLEGNLNMINLAEFLTMIKEYED